MKKLLSLLIAFLLVMGSLNAMATEKAPLVQNGGFEAFENNIPSGWEIPVGTPGTDVEISAKANEGKAAIRLFGESENVYVSQTIKGLRIGAKYMLSFYMKRESGTDITSRIDFSYGENEGTSFLTEHTVVTSLGKETISKWVKKEISFTVPPKAERTAICFRKVGSGNVYFDDVKIEGGDESGDVVADENGITWQPKEIGEARNLAPNESFEELENGFPKGWEPMSRDKIFLNTDKRYVRTGNNSIRIATKDTSLPWVAIPIAEDIIPGAICTYSAWICTADLAENIVFKTEYYVQNYDHKVYTGEGQGGPWTITKEDGWVHITGTDLIPNNSDSVLFHVRMYGSTEVYVDDVEYKITKGPEAFNSYLTDEVFYYSDWEGNGSAQVTANVKFYPEFIGNPVTFQVLDKEMVLYETSVPMGEDGKAQGEYPISVLEEKYKEYTVRCNMHDKEGNLIATKQDTVYKVDRPNYITEDGLYMENGEYFDPVYISHIPTGDEERLMQAKEIGVTLLQGYPVEEQLDLHAKLGMKDVIVLYNGGSNGESAGHPTRFNMTLETVNYFKDHPAVFAWALMDEPTPAAWPDLKKAYLAIRQIDPNHPVLITMNSNHATTGRFADIISSDSYPYGIFPFTTQDYLTIDRVVGEVKNRKPVYDHLQAFDFRNSFPTEQEMRNMLYQNFWAGAKGVGMYAWDDCSRDEEGNYIPIYDTHLWEPLKSFFALEYREVVDHFVYQKYPTFCEVHEENYRYRAWVKDGKLSLVLLNKLDRQETEATVELISADGNAKAENFTVSVINGAKTAPTGANGTFKVTLKPGQAILYSIDVDCDLSGVVSSGFFDMYNHGWAEEAVKTLNEKDILHTNGFKFYPTENVTRADFAYMLMRALEIPEGKAEAFSDVTELDYYLDEVMRGRAAGLLNGIGNGAFGEELPITRQDLMTMCMRAAAFKGILSDAEEADLSAFTDGDKIADYAKEAVSKMVGAGIVLGNTDGTVNPAGNATRAEAAVIIARLMKAA